MFAILVYDAGVKRDPKVLKLCRRYLSWVQNSVFEGEITEGKYKMLKREIREIINNKEDSVIVYLLQSTKYSSRDVIGLEKGGAEFII
jgi:CRISPR-associated protein Cas2